MKRSYHINGMTCGGCVSKVKSALLQQAEVNAAEVQLESPQATIDFSEPLPQEKLKAIVAKVGNYTITPINQEAVETEELAVPSLKTYQPLLLIVGFILGVCILTQFPFNKFSYWLLMRHFMAGFFIVFSFFKLLNIKGFANSYQMYDVVAAQWKTWGLIYPFVELALGIAYLINWNPTLTNIITIIVLGVSSIGVIKSNLNKQKIKCACLGDVFNLPMSTVTVVEDVTMVLMAVLMLIL